MIASSSPAITSSPMMAPAYPVGGASVSPGASSNTESSLSPLGAQEHSPVAMASPPVAMETSAVANSDRESLLRSDKTQGSHSMATALAANSILSLVHSQQQEFVPHPPIITTNHYLPHFHDHVIRNDMNGDVIRQNVMTPQHLQQGMTYEALQAVTSDSMADHHSNGPDVDRRHALSQLTNVNPNQGDLAMTYMPTTQSLHSINHASSDVIHNGLPSSSAAMATNGNMEQTFYVQMENGTIQAVPYLPGMPTNPSAAAAQIANITTLPQPNGPFTSSNVISQASPMNGNVINHREINKDAMKAGPYRTSQ